MAGGGRLQKQREALRRAEEQALASIRAAEDQLFADEDRQARRRIREETGGLSRKYPAIGGRP
jgi:hypothetical protein